MTLADAVDDLADLVDTLDDAGADVIEIGQVGRSADGVVAELTVRVPPSNPYEPDAIPDEYRTTTVREPAEGGVTPRVFVPSDVTDYFDSERFHVRDGPDGVPAELAPGDGGKHFADYSAASRNAEIANSTVVDEWLGVDPGDEVHFEPDGDVIAVRAVDAEEQQARAVFDDGGEEA